MSSQPMWMIRAGAGASYIDTFRDQGSVAMGWNDTGSLAGATSRDDVLAKVKACWPDYNDRKAIISAAQLWRFAKEIEVGDQVISYDPSLREYLVGTVQSESQFDADSGVSHVRKVTWSANVKRDDLGLSTRNSLGAISTLLLIPEAAVASGGAKPTLNSAAESDTIDESELLEDIEDKAREFIKDRLMKLDWDDMQELVAGLLRAMGYKTRVSPAGPDQGKDIIASPDGLGFESPRIVVEVKHRNKAMGSKEIRSFLGGRHKDDRGLYVSTGGFSKDAHYEAERASIPVTLLDAGGLVDSIVEHYESLDIETKQLVPLKRIYWRS